MKYRQAEPSDNIFELDKFLIEPHNRYSKISANLTVELFYNISLCKMRFGESYGDAKWSDNWYPPRFDAEKDPIAVFLREKLKGEVLLDLGGGSGKMEEFAASTGASVYINVDLNLAGDKNFGNISPTTNIIPTNEAFIEDTQRVFVQACILDFLSRVPDKSVNVTVNGIDSIIQQSSKFHFALAKEITRVVKQNGVAFGISSDCLYHLKNSKNFIPEFNRKEAMVLWKLANN